MNNIPTKNLNEIKARYMLEPNLKDLYVEGPNDKKILEWFMNNIEKRDVHIYHIGTIDIPSQVLVELELKGGLNKIKLIALSEKLSEIFNENQIKVKCIVDTDFDIYLNKLRTNHIIRYTDYTSMEMYFFNEPFIEKFVNLVLNGWPVAVNILINEMRNVLQRIFLIRLTKETLGWNIRWIETLHKYISWTTNKIVFNEENFIKSLLMSNGYIKQLETFKSTMNKLEEKLESDPRHNIKGHDFTYLFFLIAKKIRQSRTGFKNLETFEGALCGCLELGFVENESLFKMLDKL